MAQLTFEACGSLEAIRDAMQDAIFFCGRPDRTTLREAVSELTRALKAGRKKRPDVITATWAAQTDGLATALLNAAARGEAQKVHAVVAELQQRQEFLRHVNLFGIDERQVDADLGQEGAETHVRDKSTSTPNAKERVSWGVAAEKMLELVNRGERFTTQEEMRKRIRCSVSTINKAIAQTPELTAWADRPVSSSTGMRSLDDVITDNIPQQRERGPVDDLEPGDVDGAMNYLMEQVKPHERERIAAMGPATRRQLAEVAYRDPDFEEQENRYRRLKR